MRSSFLVLILALIAGLIQAGEEKPARNPVPAPSKSAEKIKLLKEILADEYKDTSPEGRTKLLAALMAQALALGDDPESKYFALIEAREIAIQQAKVAAALSTCDMLASDFDIDAQTEKGLTLGKLTDGTKSKEIHLLVTQSGLAALENIAGKGELGNTKAISTATERAALRAGDAALIAKVKEQIKVTESAIAELATLEKSREKLTTAPEDPTANLSLGKYNCFIKDEWEAGVKHLILGSDPALKDAAQKDIAATDVAARVAAGDAWWAWAEKQAAPLNVKAKRRAADQYTAALPELSGLSKTKVEKRLATLASSGIEPPPKSPAAPQPAVSVAPVSVASFAGKGSIRTKRAGGRGGVEFEDVSEAAGLLVGLRLAKTNYYNSVIVGGVQPVYQSGTTVKRGRSYGSSQRDLLEIVAKPGYAVGGMKYRAGDRIDSVKLIFMKIISTGLDTNDTYESDWFGGSGPPEEYRIDGAGRPIVGIHGGAGNDLDGFGLVALAPPKAAPLKLKPGVPEQCQIYACCDDKAEIYLNDKFLLNVGFEQVGSTIQALAIGDVLCVKATDTGGGYGFACLIKAQQGQTIRTNFIEWKTYAPKDPAKWWELPAKPVLVNVQKGTSKETVNRIADQAMAPRDFEHIWPVGIAANATGYLYFVVKEDSFK